MKIICILTILVEIYSSIIKGLFANRVSADFCHFTELQTNTDYHGVDFLHTQKHGRKEYSSLAPDLDAR